MAITEEFTGLEWDEADRIRKALRYAKISNLELAARLEVSKNAVSNWLNGHARPRPRDLKGIASLTGVPVTWLRPEMQEPPARGARGLARPEGFEPPTFWLGVKEPFVDQPGLAPKLEAKKAVRRHRGERP